MFRLFKKAKKTRKVKVINGGHGCRIADGVVGIIITRREAIKDESKYSGEFVRNVAPLYIREKNGNTYGLCEGFMIEEL